MQSSLASHDRGYSLEAMNLPPSTSAADRVLSIDALRGFDLFWIMGGHGLVLALAGAMTSTNEPPAWLKTQMAHTHWIGFSCWDLINPLTAKFRCD